MTVKACQCGCGRAVEDAAEYRRKGGRYRDAGYSAACSRRWRDAGYPASGPPRQRRAGGGRGVRAGRVEDYAELLGQGETRQTAAWRMGRSLRTIERYEAALSGAA